MAIKKILFLTINFPPSPSVGTHRVAKILKYLDLNRFNVTVLTLKEEYYDLINGGNTGDAKKIPQAVKVVRSDKSELTYPFTWTKAFFKKLFGKKKKRTAPPKQISRKTSSLQNAQRSSKLDISIDGIRGFLFAFFEFPDKYIGWLPNAVREGIRLIKENKIDAIYTTAPPHSLFIMALLIKKITKVKLILDYRDPWTLSRWDKGNSLKSLLERRFEESVIKAADLCLFVTPKLRKIYAQNYAGLNQDKFKLFSNGYDPDDFKGVTVNLSKSEKNTVIRFVHLGTLYKKRDPSPLFQAIAQLLNEKKINPEKIRFDFIGTVARELRHIPQQIKTLGLQEVVRFLPPVSFDESIRTMYQADVLLLIQPGTDLQIPAKLFEYMYTRKPIFAVAEPDSATERAIQEGQLGVFAPSQEVPKIKEAFLSMFDIISKGSKSDESYIQKFDYSIYIKKLERLLEGI